MKATNWVLTLRYGDYVMRANAKEHTTGVWHDASGSRISRHLVPQGYIESAEAVLRALAESDR